jgi:hypothetical protein
MMSTPYESLKQSIKSLKTASLGSLGEHIFANTAGKVLQVEVFRQHDDRCDFLVGSTRVDVKTTAKSIHLNGSELKPYRGNRITGIRYALVEFFSSGVRVSQEGELIACLTWKRIAEMWNEWRSERNYFAVTDSREEKKRLLAPIKTEIQSVFQKHGMKVRVIYRTSSKEFGRESPHNLIPSQVMNDRVTVLLDFCDATISRDNIRSVIAIPDVDASELPMLERTRLHLPKVDLNRVPLRYKFEGVDDLKNKYKRILRKTR